MKTLSSTQSLPIKLNPSLGEESKKVNIPTAKIGWLHSISDTPGATFDITIKDALGRVRIEKKNCSSQTKEYGELINLPTLLGEELEVSIENLKGAKEVQVFLN